MHLFGVAGAISINIISLRPASCFTGICATIFSRNAFRNLWPDLIDRPSVSRLRICSVRKRSIRQRTDSPRRTNRTALVRETRQRSFGAGFRNCLPSRFKKTGAASRARWNCSDPNAHTSISRIFTTKQAFPISSRCLAQTTILQIQSVPQFRDDFHLGQLPLKQRLFPLFPAHRLILSRKQTEIRNQPPAQRTYGRREVKSQRSQKQAVGRERCVSPLRNCRPG